MRLDQLLLGRVVARVLAAGELLLSARVRRGPPSIERT
jgi:hypothetical protein